MLLSWRTRKKEKRRQHWQHLTLAALIHLQKSNQKAFASSKLLAAASASSVAEREAKTARDFWIMYSDTNAVWERERERMHVKARR